MEDLDQGEQNWTTPETESTHVYAATKQPQQVVNSMLNTKHGKSVLTMANFPFIL